MAGRRDDTPSSSTGEDSSTDLPLLLDCLRYQRGCPSSQRQALTTMATMCTRSASSRDRFRTSGALSFVLDLLFPSPTHPSPSHQVQQAALYTLGCAAEQNLMNQMKLCEGRVFSLLSSIFADPSSPLALKTSAAYLAGCLMCNNSQGQSLSREGKVLHKLITLFKEHLPAQPQHPQEQGEGADSFSLWSSICSALCTATNNPQNESNQSLCCKVFPAALSVLQAPPTQPNPARPAVTLIASCIANNATAQDRLRMVGGLEVLVRALRDLLNQQHTPLHSSSETTELCLQIVKTLSAAAFGHSSNCAQLSALGVTPLLLTLLKGAGLDSPARLTIIMCLGLLAEENANTQCEIAEGGGLPLLLNSMADTKEEELCKAATFVMQCCLLEDNPKGESPSPSIEDHNISSSIARLEKLLQSKQTAVPDSPSGSHHRATSSMGLNPELLRNLDSQKLPVSDRVSRWLDQTNEPTSTSEHGNPLMVNNNVNFLQYLQLLQTMTHETSDLLSLHTQLPPNTTLPLSLFTSDPTQLQLQNLKAAYSAAKISDPGHCTTTQQYQEEEKEQSYELAPAGVTDSACGRARGRSEKEVIMLQVTGDDQQQTEGFTELRDKPTASGERTEKCTATSPERLQEPCSRRVEEHKSERLTTAVTERTQAAVMERELERERGARERLEQELARERRKIRELESQAVEGSKWPNRAVRRGESKLDQEHQTPSQTQSRSLPQTQSQSQSHAGMGPELTEPLQNAPAASPSSVQHSSGKCLGNHCKDAVPTKAAKTPRSGRSNVRYSSSVSRVAKLPKPSTSSRVSSTRGNCLRHASHVAKQTGKKSEKSQESKPAKVPPSQQMPGSTRLLSYSKLVTSGRDSTQPRTVSSVGLSHLSRDAQKPLTSSDSIGCDHQCLGCKPRLKCPLITSRSFIKLLRADAFTCTYHRRLVRWIHHHRGDFHPSPTNCKQRGREGHSIVGKDESGTSHGNRFGINEAFENSDEISSHNQTTALQVQSESCRQPPSPAHSSRSTEHHPTGCKTNSPHSVTHCDGSSSREASPCNEDSSWQYCSSDDSEEYQSLQPTDTFTPTVAAKGEPHPPPSTCPEAQSLPHKTATTSCDQQTHPHAASRKNLRSAPLKLGGVPLTARSSRLYSLKPKGADLLVQTKICSHGASPRVLRDVSNRIGSEVYDYRTPVKDSSKHLPVNTAKQAQHPPTGPHRQRVPFTVSEGRWIEEGVGRFGRRWRHILTAYPFHPRRTAVDLKDKYRRLELKSGRTG